MKRTQKGCAPLGEMGIQGNVLPTNRRRVWWLVAATMVWALPLSPAIAKEPGESLIDITLRDIGGRPVALTDYKSSPFLVLAFLGTECPLARLYAKQLQEIADGIEPAQVTVIGVMSNCQDTVPEIRDFSRKHQIRFLLLKDFDNRMADALEAERTPEVFVLDSSRTVRYRGRIDDQYLVGVQRPRSTRADLKIALDELLAGKMVSVKRTHAVGCRIGRSPVPDPSSPVTYSQQISRLLQQRCVACHRSGEIGPFPLTTYEEVVGWGETIAEVVQTRRMPPWHAAGRDGKFANDRSLTEGERELVLTWVGHGCPEGDPEELPPAPPLMEGWGLSREPDRVIAMADTPFVIPATADANGLPYQQFWVDPGFTEDVWVKEVEIRPGNRSAVHHITVNVQPEGKSDRVHAFRTGRTLGAFAPGNLPTALSEGTARRIPARSWLRFEVHYMPTGVEQEDLSHLGLVFIEPENVTHEVVIGDVYNMMLQLKPNTDNQVIRCATDPAPFDMELLSITPHMHLRGKSVTCHLERSEGDPETLLSVPQFDFNWQTTYTFQNPIRLSRGAKLQFRATYDNSSRNLANPDPSATVLWGEQTWDEMFIGYFEVRFPIEHSSKVQFFRSIPLATP